MEKPRNALADNGILWPALQVGGGAGAAGLVVGGVVGVLRSPNPLLWAGATSIQWSLLGGTYWGVRSAFLQTRKQEGITPTTRTYASTGSGALTAAVVGAVTRGRANVLPGTLIGTMTGFLGQSFFNKLEERQVAAALAPTEITPARPLWKRLINSKFSPITLLTDEDYKRKLEDKLLRVDAEIAVLDDDIAALKKGSDNPVAEWK